MGCVVGRIGPGLVTHAESLIWFWFEGNSPPSHQIDLTVRSRCCPLITSFRKDRLSNWIPSQKQPHLNSSRGIQIRPLHPQQPERTARSEFDKGKTLLSRHQRPEKRATPSTRPFYDRGDPTTRKRHRLLTRIISLLTTSLG